VTTLVSIPRFKNAICIAAIILRKRFFICRQTDDFAIAAQSARAATGLISAKVDIKDNGLLEKFNGIDVLQTRDYV
jgi:hypothetical protein